MCIYTVVDAFFRNGIFLFLECCPGIINYCRNGCRLKTSTPQTPQRAERVYVYIYVCVCMYIYIFAHTYIYIYI